MHSYSIDSNARRTTYFALAIVAIAVPSVTTSANNWVHGVFASLPDVAWPLSLGTTFAALFVLMDRAVWRLPPLIALHGIPDLNGVWVASGLSSYQQTEDGSLRHEFKMTVTVRQTFSRIEVFTESSDSTSCSTMASICSDHAVATFSYAFENKPKSKATAELQRHPGLVELRINSASKMVGDYFSGKHRLRYGELTLTRRNP